MRTCSRAFSGLLFTVPVSKHFGSREFASPGMEGTGMASQEVRIKKNPTVEGDACSRGATASSSRSSSLASVMGACKYLYFVQCKMNYRSH